MGEDNGMEVLFYVVGIGGMGLIFCAAGNAFWQGCRLARVMKRRYPGKLAELTTLWGMPGMRNPFRSIPWFIGPDYCGDEEVRRLKKATNWSLLAWIVLMVIFPWAIVATAVLSAIISVILEGG